MASTTLGARGGQQTESTNVTSTGIRHGHDHLRQFFDGWPEHGSTSPPGVGQFHAGPGHTHANILSAGVLSTGISVNGNTAPVSNVQPTIILNQIIKL